MYDRTRASKFKLLIAAFLLFTIIFSLSSCTSSKKGLLITNTEMMFDALIDKNQNVITELLINNFAEDEIEIMYMDLAASFKDVSKYSIIDYRYQKLEVSDSYLHVLESLVTTNNGDFIIYTEMLDKYNTLSNIMITPSEKPLITGTFSSIGSSNIGQILLLLLNLIEIGFIVLAFIDCFKNCKRYRIPWLVIIVLGRMVFAFKSGAVQGFNLALLLGYSSYVTTGFEVNTLTLCIPVAAVAWVFLKKRFIVPAKPEKAPEPVKKNTDFRK